MSDDDSKWLGKPILFLPANEAASIQGKAPPGIAEVLNQMNATCAILSGSL